jgi:hypothetical protein
MFQTATEKAEARVYTTRRLLWESLPTAATVFVSSNACDPV